MGAKLNRSRFEATKFGYVSVWVLASLVSCLIVVVAQQIGVEVLDSLGRAYSHDDLILSTVGIISGVGAFCWTYLLFPSINLRKVKPYIIVIGGVGVVISMYFSFLAQRIFLDERYYLLILISVALWVAATSFFSRYQRNAPTPFKGEDEESLEIHRAPSHHYHSNGGESNDDISGAAPNSDLTLKSAIDEIPTTNSKEIFDKPHEMCEDDHHAEVDGGSVNKSRAQIALAYRDGVVEAFAQAKALGEDYENLFLTALESDPRVNLNELLAELRSSAAELAPFDSNELNKGFVSATRLGAKAREEYHEAATVLGKDLNVEKILSQLKQKYSG